MIPYGKHSIDDDDIASVVSVLKSDWLTQGPWVPRFEDALASFCHVQYGVAVNSATSALHIACLALGVGDKDLVWTSPNSFVEQILILLISNRIPAICVWMLCMIS